MSSLAARHTEILSYFTRFEHYTQPRKNEGWRMPVLTKLDETQIASSDSKRRKLKRIQKME